MIAPEVTVVSATTDEVVARRMAVISTMRGKAAVLVENAAKYYDLYLAAPAGSVRGLADGDLGGSRLLALDCLIRDADNLVSRVVSLLPVR